MKVSTQTPLWSVAFAAVALAACGGDQTQAATPSEPTSALPLTTPTATAAAPPPVEPAPPADPQAASSGAPDAGAAPKATASAGGRPPVLKTDDRSITDTFGGSPAKLELGDDKTHATLKIPEGALDKGYNITFQLDPNSKAAGGLVGKLYRIKAQVAGAIELTKVDSSGPPFELRFPAGGKKEANLAIADVSGGKVKWTILAPKQLDEATDTAVFEVPSLGPDSVLHLTTRPPSGDEKK
jgi:hypothetical protein